MCESRPAPQLGSAAKRERLRSAKTIVLAPNETASATLRIADVENFPRASCRRVTAAGLRVYPPGATKSKRVPFPFRACARRGPIFLSISPVSKRTDVLAGRVAP